MAGDGVCSGCGKALPDADALGLITCPGCGRVTKLGGPSSTPSQGWPAPPVAAPPPGNQWAPPAAVAGAAATQSTTSTPPSARSSKASKASRSSKAGTSSGRRLGCSLGSVIAVAIVGLVGFGIVRSCDVADVNTAITNAFDFDSGALTLSGSGEVLPGPDGDVVMVLQDTKDATTTRRVARISFTDTASKLVWQSEPLDESTSRIEVAVVGDTMFAGTEDQLYALDPATGKTKWQTTMRDKLTVGCPNCFSAVRGRLVVRTTDAYVTAYGTRSAETLWTKRLVSTSGSISVVGDRLFVVDDPEDPSGLTPVALVDPANGKTIRSTTPTCPKSTSTPWDLELSAGDEVRAIRGSTDVMAVFGFGDACVVRWDPSTGAIRWTSRLNGLGSVDDGSIVVGRLDLVMANPGGQLVTVYLPNGKARVLAGAGDVSAQPSAIVDRTLVALTVTTRGTPRGGLAGWDLSTGERSWANASLGNAQPIEVSNYRSSDALFDGAPRSLVVPVGAGLNVFTFEGTERTFTVAPIDLATGELGTEVRRGFLSRYDSGTPSLTVEGQRGDRLIVSIENLLQSIPVSGRGKLVSYPEKN